MCRNRKANARTAHGEAVNSKLGAGRRRLHRTLFPARTEVRPPRNAGRRLWAAGQIFRRIWHLSQPRFRNRITTSLSTSLGGRFALPPRSASVRVSQELPSTSIGSLVRPRSGCEKWMASQLTTNGSLTTGTGTSSQSSGSASPLTSISGGAGSRWVTSDVLSSSVLTYRDVWASAADDVYVLAETESGTNIEHYDGGTWTTTESLEGVFLRTIWGAGANDIFAGDSFGRVYHFDGAQWALSPRFSSIAIREIHGTGPDDVFAITALGEIFHYNGSRWDGVGARANLDFVSVFATATTVYFGTTNRTLEMLVRPRNP